MVGILGGRCAGYRDEGKGDMVAADAGASQANIVYGIGIDGERSKAWNLCHDLTGTTKRLLKSGEVEFAITQNLYDQGYGALMALQGLVLNGSVPKEYMQPSDMKIICAENIGI